MNADLATALYLAGRFLLGGLFVYGGVEHFLILPVLTGIMAARGVPAARLVLIAGSVWQIVLGLLFIAGILVAPAAFGLILFTLVASWMFLNFWDHKEPDRTSLRNAFLCNIAIVGALLMAAAADL